jgi:hypothetical protein
MEQTSVDFGSAGREKSTFQKRRQNNLRVKMRSKLKMLGITIGGMVPLMMVTSGILLVQVKTNSHITALITQKSVFNAKIEQLKMVKTYTFELGYEPDSFSSKQYSITQQLPNILEDLRDTIISLQNMPNLFPELAREMTHIATMPLCEIGPYLSTLGEPSFACDEEETKAYLNKRWEEATIDYIDTARNFRWKYQGPLSVQQQREFMADGTHMEFAKLCQQLLSVEYYFGKIFDRLYEEVVVGYVVAVAVMGVLLIVVAGCTYMKWGKMQRETMVFESNGIKMLLKLILTTDINANEELRKEILENKEKFKILV